MKAVREYLLGQEYSMGNGQCPVCYGRKEDWNDYQINAPPSAVGHEKDCLAAKAMIEVGLDPVMI